MATKTPQGSFKPSRWSHPSPPTTSVSTYFSWWPLRAKGREARRHFYSNFLSMCVFFLFFLSVVGWYMGLKGEGVGGTEVPGKPPLDDVCVRVQTLPDTHGRAERHRWRVKVRGGHICHFNSHFLWPRKSWVASRLSITTHSPPTRHTDAPVCWFTVAKWTADVVVFSHSHHRLDLTV